ncbi:MAG TPA: two-component regulator propeller domain-containing protein [Bacteroidales bacterium]|nr:two-component regulator propeller domain-containing protein [Bacteroidales bacterium]
MRTKTSVRTSYLFNKAFVGIGISKPIKVLLLILITLSQGNTVLKAQNPGIICTHYNVNNGLIPKRNIWIGTLSKGLNIFNKERGVFYHLKNESEDASLLTSNIIPRGRKIAQDSQGFLWINTLMGLNKINIDSRSVEQFHGDLAGDILYDQELKVLWIVSDRLKKFNTETNKIDHFYINEEILHGIKNIGSIVMDKDGLIWLGTDAGLVLFDKKKDQFQNLPVYLNAISGQSVDKYSWSLSPINAIYEDNKGFIWIAIDKYLYKINKTDGEYFIYNHEVDNPNSLLDEKITGIYGNKSGVLWISYMGEGVSKVNISLKDIIGKFLGIRTALLEMLSAQFIKTIIRIYGSACLLGFPG